jgi:hypothetical protein
VPLVAQVLEDKVTVAVAILMVLILGVAVVAQVPLVVTQLEQELTAQLVLVV